MKNIRFIFLLLASLVSLAAQGQWQWTDKDGRKVFSDRAPPAEVLEKNILKRPGSNGTTKADAPASPAVATAAPQSVASAPKLSGLDKEMADKKKKADEAQAAQRKAEQEKITKAKIENCARAKQAKANFDSGVRISRINEKGEREVLDDAARAAELKRIQSIVDADCK
ncbi:MAG: DUF4124 domain-containing protein [Gammaproteobacteria bacterium]|uniref:DUF4124 domain-containing protein n=1 Tax=Rhodoferax sp. TaxID=50421 RepID=UPI00181AA363|nr:DUF4124 domain-containing protein [Rhodoferax sp.]MBU3899560.1 DUF4124 domain-containing protein [Gammaproteobacteria bacterium]MBA3059632.1 DUF4124 domain-containing protein [Rhodoferax sp.]MBU3997071.1 DUF4124 domain-containing protein [Gammaproteobacteria bacterium]MBU4018036.1 DUF4124 domain-containing protein [Gammaproteobacteria bacterium]MBU4080273.1 DUF4124 domain-containing protein [Gammaproteobacteria bacterium]